MELSSDEEDDQEKLQQEKQRQQFHELLNVASLTSCTKHPSLSSSLDNRQSDFKNSVNGGIGFSSRGGQSNANETEEKDSMQHHQQPPSSSAGLGFTSSAASGHDDDDDKPFIGSGSSAAGLGRMATTTLNNTAPAGLGLVGSHSSGLIGISNEESNSQEGGGGGTQNQGGLGMMMGLGQQQSNNIMMMGGGGGLGLGATMMYSSQSPTKKRKKDPNLGKWEKHTKGIGMKLLTKMGYAGSGGLGSNKRKRGGTIAAVGVGEAHGSIAPPDDAKQSATSSSSHSQPVAATTETGQVKKGISRPVEVVVRPNGLGLGFGNFKEQSQLKVNRQIEAEVRGIELPKEDEDDDESKKRKNKKEKGIFDGIDKSLLPSTESLLNRGAGSWRKGGGGKRQKKRRIVNYQDIVDQTTKSDEGSSSGKMKIIDMRGSATSSVGNMRDVVDGQQRRPNIDSSSSSQTTTALLGEELLHNVTLLLNTHEGQLRTSFYMVQSTKGKITALEAECKEMKERREVIKQRSDKMKLALNVVGQAEELVEQLTMMRNEKGDIARLDFAMSSLQGIFHNLFTNFSRDERKSLKFDTTLLPSIIKPILDTLTSSLDPLTMKDLSLSWMDHLATGIQKLCNTVNSNNEAYALREMIYMQCIVPWIRNALNLPRWDPVVNVEIGLDLYEKLVNSACASIQDAEEEENDILKEDITDEVVRLSVLPKLVRAVSHWRPKFNNVQRLRIVNPLHLWILPWLPYINNDSMLGGLLDDVRRNLKKTLSFLSKSVSNDVEFIGSCMSTLSPWTNLFEERIIFELTSNSICPRFARSLARVKIESNSTEQDWEHLHVLFEYYEKGLMSDNDFVSLVEGEVLPAWVHKLYSTLKQGNYNMYDIKTFYLAWKGQIFLRPTETPKRNSNRSAQLTLRSDSMVCRYFYGGLKMIQAAVESNHALLDSLQPSNPTNCNYRVALMHRSVSTNEENVKQSNGAVNIRVQSKAHGSGSKMTASFKEVVESFAHQHDISFRPKNSMKDGKPIFLFGDHPVYLDKNVLFALRGSTWQPISLEHLAQCC